jgi:hypothetical protein
MVAIPNDEVNLNHSKNGCSGTLIGGAQFVSRVYLGGIGRVVPATSRKNTCGTKLDAESSGAEPPQILLLPEHLCINMNL